MYFLAFFSIDADTFDNRAIVYFVAFIVIGAHIIEYVVKLLACYF